MAAQTVLSVGVFPVGVSLAEAQGLSDMPRDMMPAPQLVMLANVAAVAESGGGDSSVADEKEMVELKTVGCSYSDSEDENVIRYSYDNQNRQEVCIVEYPESPNPATELATCGDHKDDGQGRTAEGQPPPSKPCASTCNKTPEPSTKRKDGPLAAPDGVQRKKPFCCKPCHFQAQNEQEFVDHLSTHSVSKMLVVNQVEGRSKSKGKETETPEAQAQTGEGSGEAATTGDSKGLIRCERCGYNTNRYDHYIAHLKHHSKEGDNHRVFKCTLCAYTTVSQYHWRKHLRNHFPSKLHTCSQCSYFSDRKSNYIQHIRTHTGVRPFQCLYCDYSSSQKTHLTRHMRTHSGERPFKCDSCSYLAANQHEVTRHARQVHNGPKPLSCPFCEYKTADRSNFKKHVELHLNPRQFLCPLCKYAASKKCNLQYHIKSRHSGCNVDLDVSKVKLRIKKPSPDGADEYSDSKRNKLDNQSSTREDMDEEEDEDDDSSPINLSVRKSSVDQTSQSNTPYRAAKTPSITSEKEKPPKVKEAEKKVTTRQKKVKERPTENQNFTEVQTKVGNIGSKAKKRAKRLPAEKTNVQDQTEEPKSLKGQAEKESSDPQPPEETNSMKKLKLTPEPKPAQKNHNKTLSKSRKSGSKRSKKTPGPAKEASNSSDKTEKEVKEKPAKRKRTEALDLSQTLSKTRRLKAPATEKLQSKPSVDNTDNIHESGPTRTSPVKQHKTRTSSRKASGLPQAVGSKKDQTTSVVSGSLEPLESSDPHTAKSTGTSPAQTVSSTDKVTPPEPEPSLPEQTNSSEPDSSSKVQHSPTFIKPSLPPPLVLPGQRSKPTEPEDDEGIHSSHEGGSDISDVASEGSDDSGLNGVGPAKMANDPETPTDEIPTPTELKSHTCIFCDRTFSLEMQYRRHLNRHLVNVYYLDATAPR
ncbi:RE1-silencing transcription factor [Nematolebias whitei]|uniref:RE1-silencing transcription factor n=1 Tax=Nematolebias whitei TaxID=451745 RepID=UPI00189A5FE2|nr:RE1-silencing transcription factor [Nematolebias whitei]